MSTAEILTAAGIDPAAPASTLTAEQLVEAVAAVVRREDGGPQWLTAQQAEAYTGRSRKTLQRWAAEGRIAVRRGGGRAGNRYSAASIDKHLGKR